MNRFEMIYDGDPVETQVARDGDNYTVTLGERTLTLRPLGDGLYAVDVNGRRVVVAAAFGKDSCYVDIDSHLLEIREASEDGFAGGAGDHAAIKDKIFAPMPGKIVKIMVKVGDAVIEKQPMVIVEAMKMENQVNAKAAGTVKAVNFKAGDQVDTETPIIELDIPEE